MEAIKDIVNKTDVVITSEAENVCAICGKPYKLKVFLQGSRGLYLPDCDCREKEEQNKRNRQQKLKKYAELKEKYKQANFPPIFAGKRLFPVYTLKGKKIRNGLTCEHAELMQEYVKYFRPRRAKGFHYVGSVGNGKTTLAVCIGKELIKKGYSVRFMTFSQCMRVLQSTYSTKNPKSFDEQIEEFLKIDLLILDDFGRDGYKEQKLADAFEFLNALYNNRNNVILTSNPEMIEKIKTIPDFGAMLDRFHKMAKLLKFTNPSFRREGAK